MNNHISQTPQKVVKSFSPAVKVESKGPLDKETGKNAASFSGLLASRSLAGEKQLKITAGEQLRPDVKKSDAQSGFVPEDTTLSKESIVTEERVLLEETNEKPVVDQKTTRKSELIALFNIVVSGEKPQADNRNDAPTATTQNQNPAKPRSKNLPADNVTKSMHALLPDEISPVRLPVEQASTGKVELAANQIKQTQPRLNREVDVVLDDNQKGEKAVGELQGQQRKDGWKDQPVRMTMPDQPAGAKDIKQKAVLLTENLQRAIKKQPSPEKPGPDAAPSIDAETVEVVDSSKVKHYPADTEKYAWKQIGQKIIPNLNNSEITQNSAGPERATTSEPSSTTLSKTVKHLKIQLKPENLGTVQVKLTMNNGSLEVVLSASDRHLGGRLQEHSDHLSRQLKAAGVLFENLSVHIAETDSTAPARTGNGSGNSDAAQSFNEQKQSQTNNKSFGQAKDQRPDDPSQRQNSHDQNEEISQPIDHGINSRGNVLL